jgi:hypothetical protein
VENEHDHHKLAEQCEKKKRSTHWGKRPSTTPGWSSPHEFTLQRSVIRLKTPLAKVYISNFNIIPSSPRYATGTSSDDSFRYKRSANCPLTKKFRSTNSIFELQISHSVKGYSQVPVRILTFAWLSTKNSLQTKLSSSFLSSSKPFALSMVEHTLTLTFV